MRTLNSYVFYKTVSQEKKIYVEARSVEEAYMMAEGASETDWDVYYTEHGDIELGKVDYVGER